MEYENFMRSYRAWRFTYPSADRAKLDHVTADEIIGYHRAYNIMGIVSCGVVSLTLITIHFSYSVGDGTVVRWSVNKIYNALFIGGEISFSKKYSLALLAYYSFVGALTGLVNFLLYSKNRLVLLRTMILCACLQFIFFLYYSYILEIFSDLSHSEYSLGNYEWLAFIIATPAVFLNFIITDLLVILLQMIRRSIR